PVGVRKNVEVLSEFAERQPEGRSRRIVLRFLLSPTEIIGADRVEGVRVVRNEITADLCARPTQTTERIEAGLVLCSIGYRGAPIPGVPFDERQGTLHHERGRVTLDGRPVPGVYTAGWIKRGPSGVI